MIIGQIITVDGILRCIARWSSAGCDGLVKLLKPVDWLRGGVLAALSPYEKWQAARTLRGGSLLGRWAIVFEVILVVALSIALLIVIHNHFRRRRGGGNRRPFDDSADRSGLSDDERKLLLDIAGKAGLKRADAVFTMPEAFEQGVAVLMKEIFSRGASVEERKQLNANIAVVRGKLGFGKNGYSSAAGVAIARSRSSRQIPEGKTVLITRRGTGGDELEATIRRNNELELALGLAAPVKSEPGEIWRVRYNLGESIWEFDTTALSSDGVELVLSHSSDVRYVNRRRFLRVPVNAQAFVARFPFEKVPAGKKLTAPEFMPAELAELAGPGLKVEVPMKLAVGERVLVIIKLPGEKTVQNVGEVRHTMKTTEESYSVAIELVGLDESGISELVRATNTAAIKDNGGLAVRRPAEGQEQMVSMADGQGSETQPLSSGAADRAAVSAQGA